VGTVTGRHFRSMDRRTHRSGRSQDALGRTSRAEQTPTDGIEISQLSGHHRHLRHRLDYHLILIYLAMPRICAPRFHDRIKGKTSHDNRKDVSTEGTSSGKAVLEKRVLSRARNLSLVTTRVMCAQVRKKLQRRPQVARVDFRNWCACVDAVGKGFEVRVHNLSLTANGVVEDPSRLVCLGIVIGSCRCSTMRWAAWGPPWGWR
jgi:hypothetical protein